MEIVDWCFKTERIVRLKDGKCNFDQENERGCPYKHSALCLIRHPLKIEAVK